MNNRYILGIDTSNYKSSVAVIDSEKNIICDIRRFLTVKQGERGLRQSDALFQHVKNLPELFEELRETFSGQIDAVAYSSKPRPVEGSYMPVFLAGESFARTLAAMLSIPVLPFSHQEGHIEAVKAYSSFADEERFMACHFSGGTSELLEVHAKGAGYDIEIIGGSLDIAFGQVIDRAGVAMGMAFPSGQEMDDIALNTEVSSKLLTPIKVKDAWLNLSGIDTQMKKALEQSAFWTDSETSRDGLIKELFEKIADSMIKMVLQGAEKTGSDKIIMAGGVSSSRFIRDRISDKLKKSGIHAEFDTGSLSQDNAVGTALLGGKSLWR